ncbi:MAG: hypothetical protein ACNS62_23640 [Candidatus Cyclobacteriaceae bacterium M3_2C_046]
MIKIFILINVFSTIFMTGLVWFVQIIHYPLYPKIGSSHFILFEQTHTRLTGRLVAPVMLAELFSSLGLVCFHLPWKIRIIFIVTLILLLGIWYATFFIQVPTHKYLCDHFDQQQCGRLVRQNWLRTWLWSIRSLLLLFILYLFLSLP